MKTTRTKRRRIYLVIALGIGIGMLPFTLSAQRIATPINDISYHLNSQLKPVLTGKYSVKNRPIVEVIKELVEQSGMRLIYTKRFGDLSQKVSVTTSNEELVKVINNLISNHGLIAAITSDRKSIVVSEQKTAGAESKPTADSAVFKITGRILDSTTGIGLEGVLIKVKGKSMQGISTDAGTFILSGIPPGKYAITFTRIGYRNHERLITITEQDAEGLIVQLTQSASMLNEVVTTATGDQKRLEVGNDIVKINADEILQRAPVRSVTEMIQYAKIPGVDVQPSSGDPGAPNRIRMRGIGSISQSSDPAVIVDGVWISSDMSSEKIENTAAGTEGGPYGIRKRYVSNPIDDIDPATIESIEFVKGPSAASLYGQEAANGVIVIRTKRRKAGKASWNYSFSLDLDQQVRKKYGNYYGIGNDITLPPEITQSLRCGISNHTSGRCHQDSVVNLHAMGGLLDETGNATNTRHSLSIRGGTEVINYSFTGSTQENIGTDRLLPVHQVRLRMMNVPVSRDLIRPTKQDRETFTAAIGFTASERVTFDWTTSLGRHALRQNGFSFQGTSIHPADTVTFTTTFAEVRTDSRYGSSSNSFLQTGASGNFRPYSMLSVLGQVGVDYKDRVDIGRNETRLCANLECEPLINQSYVKNNAKDAIFTARTSASAQVFTKYSRFLIIRPTVGLDIRKIHSEGINNSGNLPYGSSVGQLRPSHTVFDESKAATGGAFINTTFGLFNRFFFDMGVRQDGGSSIQASKVGSFRFPKLATSWVISEESFFPKWDRLEHLRLRGAFGHASVYPSTADLYGSYIYSTYYDESTGQDINSLYLTSIGNNQLVPERSVEFEGGFDLELIDQLLDASLTIAHKESKNQIVTVLLPPSSGGVGKQTRDNRMINIGRVANRSIELGLSTSPINTNSTHLIISNRFSVLNNVVKKLGDRADNLDVNTSTQRIREGYPLAGMWQRPVFGYGDINLDGMLSESEIVFGDTTIYMGWSLPKYRSSHSINLSLLNRSLNISSSFSFTGSKTQNLTYQDNYGLEVVGANITEQAVARTMGLGSMATAVSEWRLDNVSVGYTLPNHIASRFHTKTAQIILQGANLKLWTNYIGRDPIVNSSPIGNYISDDGYTLPLPRKISLAMRLDW